MTTDVNEDIQIIENCQVEWHKRRGVLYVHNQNNGLTIIRICRLAPADSFVDLSENLLDVRNDLK